MRWTVNLTRKAHKQLVKLPQSVQDLADLAVADLEEQGVTTLDHYLHEFPIPAETVHEAARRRHGASYRTAGYIYVCTVNAQT